MKRLALTLLSVFLCIGTVAPFLISAEKPDVIPETFNNLITVSSGGKTFGIDAKTGLGKLYDSSTSTVWSQYYASPTVGRENIPIRFDDDSAWTVSEGSVEIGGENEAVFLLDWMEKDGGISSVFPGEKVYAGHYRLEVEYYTEKAKGFDFGANFTVWRTNINPEFNGDWGLASIAGEKLKYASGIADGTHKYTVDIPRSTFPDFTGTCSVYLYLKRYENASGKVIIKSVKLIGLSDNKNSTYVSNVRKNGETIELKVNSLTRKAQNLPPVDCVISFDKSGALRYDLKANAESEFKGEIHYPPTFYNDSESLKWILPKDSGLLLSALDMNSYINKRMRLGEFYCAGGLDMAFFGGVDTASNSGYYAVIDTPVNGGVLYPQSQIGEKQGYLPTIYFSGDKDKWEEDRSVRFFFESTGSYVDIAKKYREIAKEKGYVKTYKEKSAENPLCLKTADAHRVDLAIDVRAIMNYFDKLSEAGISNVMTRVADVRDTAQGASYVDLQSLIDTGIFKKIKERYPEALLYEYLNPRDIFLEPGEDDLDEDFAAFAEPYLLEGRTGKNFTGWTDITGVTAYIACPEFYLKYLQYRMKKYPLTAYPTTVKFIDILGTCSLGEGVCYNKNHPSDRKKLYNIKKEMLKAVIDLGADIHTEGAAEYMVPYATSFEGSLGFMNIPGTYPSSVDMLDSDHGTANINERIPLWQLVFHDCAGTYWHWEFGNLDLEKRNEHCDLYSLLYGEKGMFLPNYNTTFPGTGFFSTMLERMKKLNTVYKKVATDEMTNHEFLTNDGTVQKTTFSSGMSVVVNFSEEKEYTSDSISVKPWDYTILDKDGKMTAKNGNITDSSKTKTEIMPKWGLAAVLAGMFALIGFTVAGAIVYIKRRKKI